MNNTHPSPHLHANLDQLHGVCDDKLAEARHAARKHALVEADVAALVGEQVADKVVHSELCGGEIE